MNRERWGCIADVYQAALEREPFDRQRFVTDACGNDDQLRREVESLLAQDQAVGPLDAPVLDAAADLFGGAPELLPGTRLGPYEIVSFLGAGGMGEVYRARDLKLGRDVALKVMPSDLAEDRNRLSGFRHEAQVLASMNHAGIGAIYGLEEGPLSGADIAVGEPSHAHALILELVEGPTLADRISRGPIAVDEAVAIATQVAEALHASHRQGIIHCDVKPANIKVRADGRIKVLDFGLAKLVARRGSPDGASPGYDATSPEPSTSTSAGVIGTAAYMSPEQARGDEPDQRSDIWAFACVVYEMLTARRVFAGETVADVLASVMTNDPDWAALPVGTPSSIQRLLERSLLKDRRARLSDMSVVLYLLDEASREPARTSPAPPGARRPARSPLLALVCGAVAGVTLTGAAAWTISTSRVESAPAPLRFEVVTPASQPLWPGSLQSLAISADGTRIVYRAGDDNRSWLVLRARNEIAPRNIPGASGSSPFFSSDGRSIGFFASGQLKRVAVDGGTAITVCPHEAPQRGATWSSDDTIVFATADRATGLLRVAAAGGTPTVLTRPDGQQGELDHWFPEFLPANRGLLFTVVRASPRENQIAVLDQRTGMRKILVEGGSQAAYVDGGHLVYAAGGGIRAVRFDLERLEVAGKPIQVAERVLTTGSGLTQFAVAPVGTLVYVPVEAGPAEPIRSLVWVDRDGRERPVGVPPRAFAAARLSPDGTRIALGIGVRHQSIALWDREREVLTPLIGETGSEESHPVWTSDGARLVFSSNRGGSWNLYWQPADGSSVAEPLLPTPRPQYPHSVSRDGSRLFLTQLSSPETGADAAVLQLKGVRQTQLLVRTAAQEFGGEVSPDGRWLAYQSNESGSAEIYVRSLPDPTTARWQISNNGGTRPAWTPDGRELLFFDRVHRLTSVRIHGNASAIAAGRPVTLFEAKYFANPPLSARPYDVSPDGQLLMIKESHLAERPAATSFIVVEHWSEELKRHFSAR